MRTTTRGGKTAKTIDALKQAASGALVCHPNDAGWWASRLEEEGASVVCTLGVDFTRPTEEPPR